MYIDKRRAKRHAWRIPEWVLFASAGCFGALGGMLAMQMFRHKTQHLSFNIAFPVFLLVQIALLAKHYGIL